VRRGFFAASLCCFAAAALGQSHHVVLVVWDGMRPDFVNERYTPTLNALAHDGVRFQNHHSIYCTATDVNGTALATGVYPNRSGIFANTEFRPRINARHAIDSADQSSLIAGDALTNGKYLSAPTVAELARAAGKRVALVGTKSVAVLFDRKNEWSIATSREKALTIFAGAPISTGLTSQVTGALGPFLIESGVSSVQRNQYGTRALTDVLWRDGVPDFSLLWLSEPDLTEHNDAPGSPQALAAIKASDDNLAAVLHALDQKHARETTDVLVVSDHGFSTIRRSIDVAKLLSGSGFRAAKELPESPQRGDILAVGNGGTVLFYVQEHDRETCARLVDWLQERDFAGAIFSRETFEGTLPLSAIRIDTPDAADVVMAFRWSAENNQFGVPGLIDADWNRKPGQGTHATLSPFDVHATFVAAGPDFRRSFQDVAPTANIDVAPTILHLLGVNSKAQFDGRVVGEALRDSNQPSAKPVTDTLAAKKSGEAGWQQWLKTSRIGDTTYFDAALGGQARK
jgi:arylsulfatase A-like enzyme